MPSTRRFLLSYLALIAIACGGKTTNNSVPNPDAAATDTTAVDTGMPAVDAALDVPVPKRRSCAADAAGAGRNCGLSGGDDCCSAPIVPGGSYLRFYDGGRYTVRDYPASVSPFRLDKFEVTVGRFRAFVSGYTKPVAGDGAHPRIPGSGWNSAWPLANDGATLRDALTGPCDGGARTWTSGAGANEHLPMNCVTWYEAFAFCAWDGARLATSTERNFAAAGGDEQRVYPWSMPPTSAEIDPSYAVYALDVFKPPSIQPVGNRPKGAGRWEHLDLAGNVFEWVLDAYGTGELPRPCVDCALIKTMDDTRTTTGGAYSNLKDQLLNGNRLPMIPATRSAEVGFRCAH
jgi:formylglycine-generating enzyme